MSPGPPSLRHRLHTEAYRLHLRLAPRSHRERHGARQVELFADLLATGHAPWRLWCRAAPDLVAVVLAAGGRRAASHVARLALVPLSLAAVTLGGVLAVMAVGGPLVPTWVALIGAGLVVQGGWAMAWLSGRPPFGTGPAMRLTALGEATALLLGATGLVIAVLRQTGAPDPEYGPLTVSLLLTVHAVAGLAAVVGGSSGSGPVR